MSTITETVPEFASEVASALEREGELRVSALVPVSTIERCTFDPSVNAAYLYIAQSFQVTDQAPVARTIPFADPHWFNVDIAHDGGIFGIEILGRSDVIRQLRSARAL